MWYANAVHMGLWEWGNRRNFAPSIRHSSKFKTKITY